MLYIFYFNTLITISLNTLMNTWNFKIYSFILCVCFVVSGSLFLEGTDMKACEDKEACGTFFNFKVPNLPNLNLESMWALCRIHSVFNFRLADSACFKRLFRRVQYRTSYTSRLFWFFLCKILAINKMFISASQYLISSAWTSFDEHNLSYN